MNVKKTVAALILAIIIAMGSLASAQENNAKEDSNPAEEQSISRIQIKGMIEKTADGAALMDGETAYLLKGKKDLDLFVGKTVLVTGDGYTSDSEMIIVVKQIQELK